MFSTINAPEQTSSFQLAEVHESNQTQTLVILHPLPIYADAIQSVIHRHSRWRVVGATTDIEAAVTMSTTVDAVLFDTRTANVGEISRLAHRLRKSRPALSLLLLTRHERIGFLKNATDADIDSVAHMCDSVATVRAALDALEYGRSFRSSLITARADGARGQRRQGAKSFVAPVADAYNGRGIAMGS